MSSPSASVSSLSTNWAHTVACEPAARRRGDSRMLKSLPKLSRQELEVACEDFSNIIGSTPQTVVYKGTMKDDGPETIGHGLTEIILMRRLTTLSTEDPPTTRWESFDQYVGVGTQIRVASLHKAMVNAPKQGSSSVFVTYVEDEPNKRIFQGEFSCDFYF
ncbi:putative LRR receptor-like serine/threonine-protein kinase [Hordeum vulgare]|nr:putative LRR receptor-like serine/threonine-protein kinase [Hordeum vulgare]